MLKICLSMVLVPLLLGCQQLAGVLASTNSEHQPTSNSQIVQSSAKIISSEIWLPAGTFHAEVEGPTLDQAGNFYAVNLANSSQYPAGGGLGSIGQVDSKGQVRQLLQLPAGSIGNGLHFSADGALWIADYKQHKIWRFQQQQLQQVWFEPAMHQPNDLVVMRSGIILATDPAWRKGSGQLWRFSQAKGAELISAAMGTTNGIALSPDERWLYVNESVQRRVWRFSLSADGQLGSPQLIHQFADFGLDGMDTSVDGDLWIARHGKGTVVRLSPQGQLRAEYCLHGKHPSNLVFSQDGQWLYVTIQREGSVERLAVNTATPCG